VERQKIIDQMLAGIQQILVGLNFFMLAISIWTCPYCHF